ncbi:hypothetical protein DRE_03866 [Drechslerella stenobrocha 248]|uniref:Glycosyl transferase CAP10 domain-containing protein n=1 Tax=Drechslerella stenobrocha 248 TaxID=1043628 RepID=W7HTS3_9PEZI|nr:hypothetical protein DRE_03866 [Drechslerella stenobrocha 248]
MGTLQTYLLPSLSRHLSSASRIASVGTTGVSSGSGSGGVIGIFFLSAFVAAVYTPDRSALLVSAVSWATVAVVLFAVRVRADRRGENVQRMSTSRKEMRKAAVLVACVLLSGLCEWAVGPSWTGRAAWWNKAGVPLVTGFLRSYLLADPGVLDASARGSKRLFAVVALVAFLALSPAVVPDRSVVVGLANVLFQSVTFVLLEDIALGSAGRGGKGVPSLAVPDIKSLASSWYSGIAAGAAVGLAALSACLEKPLDSPAMPSQEGFSLLETVGIGAVGGLAWLCVPLIVSRLSAPPGSLVDLAATLAASQLVLPTSPVQAIGTVTALVLISLHFVISPTTRETLLGLGPTKKTVAVFFIFIIFTSVMFSSISPQILLGDSAAVGASSSATRLHEHPIKHLIEQGEKEFEAMKQRQSTSLQEAVKNYWKKYKMPPPVNFDKWYEFAVAQNSVLIDEYDTIFHQLRPFWGMPPKTIRNRAREALGFEQAFMRLSIRKGQVIDLKGGQDWQRNATVGMIDRFKQWIPDMDLAFNLDDQPRVVIPWEETDALLSTAAKIDYLESPKVKFTGFPGAEKGTAPDVHTTRFKKLAHQPIWSYNQLSCPPGTPARDPLQKTADATEQYTQSPVGFISNQTAATEICLQPSLNHRFTFFQQPSASDITRDLVPVFSQSKFSSYNDILYPPPLYWAGKHPQGHSDDIPWEQKQETLYWRGSMGHDPSQRSSWQSQQQQQVVTHLTAFAEHSETLEATKGKDRLWRVKKCTRGAVRSLIDVAFSNTQPQDNAAWRHKYLLEMDDSASSGRFYDSLKSNSAVFKVGLSREWHGDWVMPWVHYVPLSLSMGESTEVLRYFARETEGREAARRIAEQGKKWADTALRREDFEVWFFRLLLE